MFKYKALLLTVVILLTAPSVGVAIAGCELQRYLEFPPRTLFVQVAPFSWAVFWALALILTTFFGPFFLQFFKTRGVVANSSRQESFPWWGYAGGLWLFISWIVAWSRFYWARPIQPHTFLFLWLGYIVLINAAVFARQGSSPLTRCPWRYALLFPVSAFFWWTFEYLNRYVQNWSYDGISNFSRGEYFWFASLSFATVLPAVFATKEWVASWPSVIARFKRFIVVKPLSKATLAILVIPLCILSLLFLGVFPQYLFPLIWLTPLFLLCAIQCLCNQPTILRRVSLGDWREVVSWALAALLCGVFWEMWNYLSFAKWSYHISFVQRLQIFEMPVLGYAGYLPFGVLCGAVVELITGQRDVESYYEVRSNLECGPLRVRSTLFAAYSAACFKASAAAKRVDRG